MATLISGDLAPEITFGGGLSGYVGYLMSFTWRGRPVVNTAILKGNEKREDPTTHHCLVSGREYRSDWLISSIENALDNNLPVHWHPLEWELEMAILPQCGLSLTPDKPDAEPRYLQPTPTDCFTLAIKADASNFAGVGSCGLPGFTVEFITDRQSLRAFKRDLAEEYERADERHDYEADSNQEKAPPAPTILLLKDDFR